MWPPRPLGCIRIQHLPPVRLESADFRFYKFGKSTLPGSSAGKKGRQKEKKKGKIMILKTMNKTPGAVLNVPSLDYIPGKHWV